MFCIKFALIFDKVKINIKELNLTIIMKSIDTSACILPQYSKQTSAYPINDMHETSALNSGVSYVTSFREIDECVHQIDLTPNLIGNILAFKKQFSNIQVIKSNSAFLNNTISTKIKNQ
jgi:hypothetical protein